MAAKVVVFSKEDTNRKFTWAQVVCHMGSYYCSALSWVSSMYPIVPEEQMSRKDQVSAFRDIFETRAVSALRDSGCHDDEFVAENFKDKDTREMLWHRMDGIAASVLNYLYSEEMMICPIDLDLGRGLLETIRVSRYESIPLGSLLLTVAESMRDRMDSGMSGESNPPSFVMLLKIDRIEFSPASKGSICCRMLDNECLEETRYYTFPGDSMTKEASMIEEAIRREVSSRGLDEISKDLPQEEIHDIIASSLESMGFDSSSLVGGAVVEVRKDKKHTLH